MPSDSKLTEQEVRERAFADLVVFNPKTLGCGATRTVRDFPAQSQRLVIDAAGYEATVVGGEVFFERGEHTGALPGRFLRRN